MNRAAIRSQVEENTARTDKTTTINNAIDAALKKISSRHNWRDLLTEATVICVIDQEFIALASDVRRLAEVRWMDGLSSYEIEIRPKSWLIHMWPDFSVQPSNKPRFAYLEGTTLYMTPRPATANTLKYSYYKRHASLTDDNTSIDFTIADEAVIAYATYRVFKSVQMHEDATMWLADFQQALKDAKEMDRHSGIVRQATPRGLGEPVHEDYYLDPFVKEAP
jgi:hypothetical protein